MLEPTPSETDAATEARLKKVETPELALRDEEAAAETRIAEYKESFNRWKLDVEAKFNEYKEAVEKQLTQQRKTFAEEMEKRANILIEQKLKLDLRAMDLEKETEQLKIRKAELEEGREALLKQVANFSELIKKQASEAAQSFQSLAVDFWKQTQSKEPGPMTRPQGTVGDLLTAILAKNESATLEAIEGLRCESPSDLNQAVDDQGSTILHIAARTDSADVVWALLHSGCDPTLTDNTNKTPYNCTRSKECRTVFRKFWAQLPDQYDYEKAGLPAPLPASLTDEQQQEWAELERARKKHTRLWAMEKKVLEAEKEELLAAAATANPGKYAPH